ncbi:MAG: ABC transporter ATP-binding protein [Candidatus Caldatribacteriaceae bacterium]
MEIVLKGENLKAFYVLEILGEKRIVKAVNGIDIEIPKNAVFGIAGESGCGKSTLLRVLYGAIDPPLRLFEGKLSYFPDGGAVDVFALQGEAKRRLRFEYISYVPQGSMSVFNPVRRIKSTFLDFLESHVGRGKEQELLALVKEHLRALGLPLEVLEAYPHQLSGGMRQRVAIALATLLKPRIILADEPTTALDVVAQRAVLDLLEDIQRTLKNTIVLVTHDMGVQAQITTHLAIMYAGRIVEEGETRDIFHHPLHPYTQYLIQSLPRIGDKSPRTSVPGSPPSLLAPPSGCPFHPRCPEVLPYCQEEVPPLLVASSTHKVACFLRKEEEP